MMEKLEKTPIDKDFSYDEIKQDALDSYSRSYSAIDEEDELKHCKIAVVTKLFWEDDCVEEYGMTLLVLVISAMLFCMKKQAVYPELLENVKDYIAYFDTGEYDELFEPDDLKDIKADIAIIKAYISK